MKMRRRSQKRAFAIILSIIMLIFILPVQPVKVMASEEDEMIVEGDNENLVLNDATPTDAEDTSGEESISEEEVISEEKITSTSVGDISEEEIISEELLKADNTDYELLNFGIFSDDHAIGYRLRYYYGADEANPNWIDAFDDDFSYGDPEADIFDTVGFSLKEVPADWDGTITFMMEYLEPIFAEEREVKNVIYGDLAPKADMDPTDDQDPDSANLVPILKKETTLIDRNDDVDDEGTKLVKTTITFTTNANTEPHIIRFQLSYTNEGLASIKDNVNSYLYAYSVSGDITAYDGTYVGDAEKHALAVELVGRFFNVPMDGEFGLTQSDMGGKTEFRIFRDNVDNLKDRITYKGAGNPITVITADGAKEQRNVNIYEVDFGHDGNGVPIVMEIPVVHLTSENEFIVCTDFDGEKGTGTTYYSRIAGDDVVQFSNEGAEEYIGGYIVYDDYSNVVIGGNYLLQYELNTDGIYSAELSSSVELFYNEDYAERLAEELGEECRDAYRSVCLDVSPRLDNGTVRILNPDNTYIILSGQGETKHYDQLGGRESAPIDNVWRTGEDAVAYAYIGDTSVFIKPLSDIVGEGHLNDYKIADVTLKDNSQRDGVTIDKSDLNKVKVSFASNFYDSVPLIIKYENGETGELIVQRIGLVIQYRYMIDPSVDPDYEEVIACDCNNSRIEFDYDYEAGEQIIIYATYYHPTIDKTASGGNNVYLSINYDDGNTEIISSKDPGRNFNGYAPATDDGVATTSFIIGFAPAGEWTGTGYDGNHISSQTYKNKFGNTGGFSATVINAGYDNDATYGGTQIGSGAGVYWDGHIKWNKR